MNPSNLQELITLLTQIQIDHGGETEIQFQDFDEGERDVQIVIERRIDYTDFAKTTKKLCIRYL